MKEAQMGLMSIVFKFVNLSVVVLFKEKIYSNFG